MLDTLMQRLLDPHFLIAVLVAVAAFSTVYTVATPYLTRADLNRRTRAVTTERERLRSRNQERLNAPSPTGKASLRANHSKSATKIVERFNLREALVDANTVNKLKSAGFRSQNALNTFLAARFILPFVFLLVGGLWVFGLNNFPNYSFMTRLVGVLVFGYLGFYAPNIYVSNRITKRQKSIKRNWPDALDLMLICVESGTSMEVAMRRVAEEMTEQSPELAEEMVLTVAELSFLQDRRVALENLGLRTQLDNVKNVVQALIQAERYGTPLSQALRVMSQEGRDERMNEAEKKAAALPPKLTVPMILFFLPVLVAVILGPAGIRVADTF